MSRVMSSMVKEQLVLPFVDVTLEYYDLSLANRDLTDDKVVLDGAAAVKRWASPPSPPPPSSLPHSHVDELTSITKRAATKLLASRQPALSMLLLNVAACSPQLWGRGQDQHYHAIQDGPVAPRGPQADVPVPKLDAAKPPRRDNRQGAFRVQVRAPVLGTSRVEHLPLQPPCSAVEAPHPLSSTQAETLFNFSMKTHCRHPVVCSTIPRFVKSWANCNDPPPVICRHACGDHAEAAELDVGQA